MNIDEKSGLEYLKWIRERSWDVRFFDCEMLRGMIDTAIRKIELESTVKFKAQPKLVDQKPSDFEMPLDADGYVHGWYVDGFIVGGVIESTEEYVSLEYWCPVDVSTLKKVHD